VLAKQLDKPNVPVSFFKLICLKRLIVLWNSSTESVWILLCPSLYT